MSEQFLTLSSPAQKMNSASEWLYSNRLTISPLLIATGRTSRFIFPIRTINNRRLLVKWQFTSQKNIAVGPYPPSIGRFGATLFSRRSRHCLHWNSLSKEVKKSPSALLLIQGDSSPPNKVRTHPQSGSEAR